MERVPKFRNSGDKVKLFIYTQVMGYFWDCNFGITQLQHFFLFKKTSNIVGKWIQTHDLKCKNNYS